MKAALGIEFVAANSRFSFEKGRIYIGSNVRLESI
jgi:hypothetical protein